METLPARTGKKYSRSGAWAAILIVLFLAIAAITNRGSTDAGKTVAQSGTRCDQGTPISGRYYVTRLNVNFRKGPGTEYDRVVNAKATQVLGSTDYRTLNPVMLLEGLCATEGWIQAKIVEADGKPVNWESGWVARQFVTNSPSAEMTAGLIWGVEGYDDLTAEEKAILKRAALKVLRDEPKCAKVIHGHRDTFKKGGYYISCVSSVDAHNFNIFFSRQDLEAGAKIGIPESFDEAASRRGCVKAIKDRISHPSTLTVHSIMGYATKVHDNGARTIIQDFTASNGFGLAVRYRARCLIDPDGSLEIAIVEVG
jgi:hypothetical protein